MAASGFVQPPSLSLARRTLLVAAPAAFGVPALAQTGTGITLQVTHGFAGTHAAMMTLLARRFAETHPGLSVQARLLGDNWDPLLQATLRGGTVGDLPDLSHQSLNYARLLASRGLVQPLDSFMAEVGGLAGLGLPARLSGTGRVDGRQVALPVATTLPILYLNGDLLARAGAHGALGSWPEVMAAIRGVAAVGGRDLGGFLEYGATNAWMFQNLVAAFGGSFVQEDERDILFDGPAGLEALRIVRGFGEGGGPDLTTNQARQAFNAGTLGVLGRSASGIAAVGESVGTRFRLRLETFPVAAPGGRLVGAGNGVVVHTRDPARQRAAWAWIRFVTGPEGQAILARMTGYVPVNLGLTRAGGPLEDWFQANPVQRALVGRVDEFEDWYAFPANTARIFEALVEGMRRVATRAATPEAALAFMADSARRLMRSA